MLSEQEIYCIKEIFSSWLLSVMSSKDFKWGLIVIKKFKFSQGSLKNADHQFPDRFYFIPFTNVNWFLVTISHFNGLRKSFQMLCWKFKSIEIWLRNREKQFRIFSVWALLTGVAGVPRVSRPQPNSRIACMCSLSPQNTKSRFSRLICILQR